MIPAIILLLCHWHWVLTDFSFLGFFLVGKLLQKIPNATKSLKWRLEIWEAFVKMNIAKMNKHWSLTVLMSEKLNLLHKLFFFVFFDKIFEFFIEDLANNGWGITIIFGSVALERKISFYYEQREKGDLQGRTNLCFLTFTTNFV